MPRLRRLVRKLKLRWLAGFVGGFAFACSAPTNPGEMPPLAPRPGPVQPVPSEPTPNPTTTPPVVPGAPDPIRADAGTIEVPGPEVRGARYQMHAPADAGVDDALELPPSLPDALPADASKLPQVEPTSFSCC